MQFKYEGPRMRGAQTTFQQWQITPQSSQQFWGPNDVIKLMGNIDQGLIDFYRSHIQFEIQVTPQMQPVGLIQLDSSAQSLISQTVLLSNQRQIQRIQQYDVLAGILTDINYIQYTCQSKSSEGIGFNNIGTFLPAQNAAVSGGSMSCMSTVSAASTYSITQSMNGGGFNPTGAGVLGGHGAVGVGFATALGITPPPVTTSMFSPGINGGTGSSLPASFSNWTMFNSNPVTQTVAEGLVAGNGRAAFVRAEYALAPQLSGYPDGPNTIPLTSPLVKNQSHLTYGNLLTAGFSPTRPYETYYGGNTTQYAVSGDNLQYYESKCCGANGYTKPISRQFATGANQPVISATIPQVQLKNGKLLDQPIPLARKKFRMPLISAILGILIPPDQFQLIPAAALKNIILQISLNPYAFFTSGYSDIHQYDSYGMQTINMQKRQWNIVQFNWTWHLYTFIDKQITKSLQTKLSQGIVISSVYWQNSAHYQLQNGSYVRNTFQIPVNCESLAQVAIVFLSNQFQTKSFCRKQFRLSNNITSMQFKANGNYFPLQPVLGNAGNPQAIDTSGDNWEFYELLLLSNNYFMNLNTPLPKINTKNFAINGRCYDSTDKKTYMPSGLYRQIPNYQDTSVISGVLTALGANGLANYNTALGQAWFHQNRYIGKAVYSYSFQPYGHSKGYIMGLDTRGFRQFDVTFNSLPTDVFPYDETMLVFCRSNIVVKYSFQGIQVMGI